MVFHLSYSKEWAKYNFDQKINFKVLDMDSGILILKTAASDMIPHNFVNKTHKLCKFNLIYKPFWEKRLKRALGTTRLRAKS